MAKNGKEWQSQNLIFTLEFTVIEDYVMIWEQKYLFLINWLNKDIFKISLRTVIALLKWVSQCQGN